ncbi:MAG: RNA-binding domain-containing protein [Desulfurococcaceae archaeon TW002]
MFVLTVTCEVRPTEDKNKVVKAITNLFSLDKIEVVEDYPYYRLVGESNKIESLIKLHRILRQERILDTFRSVLLSNKVGNTTEFRLNKQSAYVGRVTLVTLDSESPLGPIIVRIISDKIDEVIDWLAPKTVGGHPIQEKKIPKV